VASHALSGSLPILVADLSDGGARDFLQGVALAEQVAFVPLLVPPVDRSTHLLEVYSPESAEPLCLIADPVGAPTREGFPLRLRLWQAESAAALRIAPKRPTTLRARHETSHELTERHAADLCGEIREAQSGDLVGRALANGKLQIESLIGGGGVGAVYRAQHRELRIPVAVKVLHEAWQADVDFGRRFHAEALAASRLDHPNVTRVLDFGQEPDGLLYLVMEYLDGVGLRTILEREKRLTTERVVRLVSQVCAALAHAHARNVIHKDIKPENLVIVKGSDDEGNPMEVVKVCDFGIAQAPHVGAEAEPRTFQGTPEYMSPEQCQSLELDARSDIYSVGIVMYELVTGEVPFTGDDVGSIVAAHLHQAPDPPSSRVRGVDPRLERIIMRALAKDRTYRYPTMRDLRLALRELLDKPPSSLGGQQQRVVIPSLPTNMPETTPKPPSPAEPAADDGWLIHGVAYGQLELDRSDRLRTSELMTDPSAFMRRLVATTDPKAFAKLVQPIEGAIRELVESLQIETLWRLASTLDLLATEGPQIPGSRAAISRALLRVIRGPGVLAPVAQHVLATGDSTGIRLLVAAGAFGAHALYSARVRCGEPEARPRFIRALEAIGTAALPILRGGLERLADRLAAPGAIEIAEDLLASLPPVHDEALGALVARYARSTEPTLARAAVAALPSLWRERSRAIVLGLVEHPNEDIAVAAMNALAELGITDAHTPRRLATIFDRAQSGSLRLAATRALAKSRGEARPVSAALVEARLRRGTYPRKGGGEVLLALARTFVALAGDRAAAEKLVQEVAQGWPPELASQCSNLGPPPSVSARESR
jgi:serine/threonine-protein kinase